MRVRLSDLRSLRRSGPEPEGLFVRVDPEDGPIPGHHVLEPCEQQAAGAGLVNKLIILVQRRNIVIEEALDWSINQ